MFVSLASKWESISSNRRGRAPEPGNSVSEIRNRRGIFA